MLQVTESVALYQAVAQLYPDEFYQHDVGSTEQKPDLIQSQIRFSFLYHEKSWNYTRE